MAELKQCQFCNKPMSSVLENCPHCHRVISRTVSCYVCSSNVTNLKAYTIYETEICPPNPEQTSDINHAFHYVCETL